MKNTIAQCKGRGNYLNTIYYSTPQCLRGFTSILGKHQVSYLANFTNRQHLRVPTEFLARAGRARPHTSCQPYSSTEPRLPLHDGRATSPESPSVSMLHDGRATYPRHLRVSSSTTGGRPTRDTPCHTERRVPSLPAPSPENRTLCVSCVLAQERVHICPRLFCDLLHYLALFS
jgi:hypothetical protein